MMVRKIIKLEQCEIEPCNSIIIRLSSYDDSTLCGFRNENCSSFTHAKGIIIKSYVCFSEDEPPVCYTEFKFLIGTLHFLNNYFINVEENEVLRVSYNEAMDEELKWECIYFDPDASRIELGNEKTFGESYIPIGKDDVVGEIYFFTNKITGEPVGILLSSICDGYKTPREEVYRAFVDAFGIRRMKLKNSHLKIYRPGDE